ncbi:DUF6119 family protein [Pedobacter cryoconitis]|uniref:Uncharacterized protein (TIGR04141 family) n=1 Tax=Pedobacter cryoconitis TaxID=188932 RepID=A0A7X0J993_9SPHI|nr:DUF6119 family protein [Pedobacter cryoconitis]MBB6503004.1 uncharacterized protein (TIGR04141 family) [Pedobacter cryoconitis]
MTIVPNIFKIDKLHKDLHELKDTIEIIKNIIFRSYSKKKREIDHQNPRLNNFRKDNINYYLHTYTTKEKDSDWSTFLPEELKENEKFSQTSVNLILFIESEHELFAIVGGSAYWIIANFIDHLFGLLTYDRIISLENDFATSTKSRGLTGQRVGMSEQYRDEYRMINYLQFGKVPKELHIKLANETSVLHFSKFLSKPAENMQIAVGRAFKINKEVDFNKLHVLINELSTIMTMVPKDFLSSYIQIREWKYLEELRALLMRKIYDNIPYLLRTDFDPRGIFEFDFCNPNKIEAFYEAEHYELVERTESGKKKDGLFKTVLNKDEIYPEVIKRAYHLHSNNQRNIMFYLYGVHIQCYIGRKQTATSGFMFHFNAEFSLRNESVFLVDGKWYKLKNSFIDSLIDQTERILRNSKLMNSIVYEPWAYNAVNSKYGDEGDYNLLYDGVKNYIVFDKVIVEGVELCDILHISGKEIYLIHVKQGFSAKVRELTNQILISARRLQEAIKSKQKEYFDKLYHGLLLRNRSTNGLTIDEFYNIFIMNKPIYVFATASQLTDDLIIEDNMRKYDSNIARFSLTTCYGEMQTNFYELKTVQITRG